MSQTTTDERTSTRLVVNLVNRSMGVAWSNDKYPEFAVAKNALLSRIAALEAVADAARATVDSIKADKGFGGDGLNTEGLKLQSALNALDEAAR